MPTYVRRYEPASESTKQRREPELHSLAQSRVRGRHSRHKPRLAFVCGVVLSAARTHTQTDVTVPHISSTHLWGSSVSMAVCLVRLDDSGHTLKTKARRCFCRECVEVSSLQ